MYSNETKNFNLPQFLATDKIDPVADFNPAFATIDKQMQQNKITAEDALAGVAGAQKDAEDAQLAAQRAENAATAAAQSAQEANENAQNAVQKVDDLEKEVESIQDAQTAQGTQISELSNEYHVFVRNQTALNTAQDNINTSLQEKDAAIEGQISALDTRVTKNESDIKALQESTASDKAELDQKIEMNAQVLSDTRNTVTTHTEQISTLTETVEHNSDDMETAQTAIAGNASNIVKVYGKEVPAEADPNLSNTALAASGERHREAIAQIYGNYPVPNIESTKNLQGLDQRVRALESGGGDVTKDYVDQQDENLQTQISATHDLLPNLILTKMQLTGSDVPSLIDALYNIFADYRQVSGTCDVASGSNTYRLSCNFVQKGSSVIMQQLANNIPTTSALTSFTATTLTINIVNSSYPSGIRPLFDTTTKESFAQISPTIAPMIPLIPILYIPAAGTTQVANISRITTEWNSTTSSWVITMTHNSIPNGIYSTIALPTIEFFVEYGWREKT